MEIIGATEARASFAELLRRVSAEGERIVIERRGKPRAMLVPIDDQDQADVSANLAARRESEALLSQAAQMANLGHWVRDDVQEKCVYCSETLARMFGVTVEEYRAHYATLEGRLEQVHPENRARYEQTIAEAKLNKRAYDIEFRDILPDGRVRYLREYGEPQFDETGRHVRTIGTLQDITAIRKTEDELRESERRYRELFDESPVAIWEEDWSRVRQMLDDLAGGGVKDLRDYFNSHRDQLKAAYDSAEITEVSRATVDIYRAANKEELVGWTASGFVIDEELDAFRDIVLSFSAGQTTVEIQSRDTTLDDSEIVVKRRVVIPPTYRDDWSRVIYAIEDITERARAEEQLRQVQKTEAVGQLTGGVAHDFNNLLAIILGNAELLSAKVGEDDPQIQAVIRAATRGAELTQRLLAFSRKQTLQPQVVEVNALVGGMIDLLSRSLGETIEIETGVAPDLWNASADPAQVENALLNLALNARDAMPGGGKLTIECANARLDETYVAENIEAKAGDYVVLAVSDTGSGMGAEVQARALEPFFTTKEVGQGSGLGLSMVYGFTKQTGGHVTIESEEGRGTTVKLYLPRAEGAAVRPSREATTEPRGRGESILVIEDDLDVRGLAVKMLGGLGYRVIDVPDAASAHKVLTDGKQVDLVLSDVVLAGGTSGPEFAEETHATYPDLKIIFMSGYPAEAAKRDGFLGSDNVLLNKPFQRQQLAKALRDELDGSSAK
jgi:prevent-host-death family protein